MATVTGIVDGAGSLGAAAQGVLVGVFSERYGWTGVFYALNVWCGRARECASVGALPGEGALTPCHCSALLSSAMIAPLTIREMRAQWCKRRAGVG